MTCKFCGSALEDNEIECPYCGHKVGNSAKALAADMAAKFAPGSKSNSSVSKKQRKTSSRAGSSMSSKLSETVSELAANSKMLLAVVLVVFFIFLMITMFTAVSTKNQVADMYQDMLSQFYQIQSTNTMLSSQIDRLSSPSSVSAPAPSGSSGQTPTSRANITKQPSDCATYIGRTGNIPIFTVEATGTGLAFNWQRYDEATGNWSNIVFDGESNNTTYGIHLYNNVSSSQGYSELSAHDVTAAAYGKYRCVVADSYGEKATETVALTERPAD